MTKKIVVGISGASGMIYGIRFLEISKEAEVETHLVLSEWAKDNIMIESDYSVQDVIAKASHYHENRNLAASISSGSFKHDGMIVLPCSMKTLASIANGYSDNLLSRAADVTIKEGRKLVLVVRETPFSAIHLENMLKLSRIGVVIMPPVPAMYARPRTIDDIVLHTINRAFDQFGIKLDLIPRWSGMDLDSLPR